MRVSVCLAAYNGSRFITPQIASILAQLGRDDELVVVDDASHDDTCAVVEGLNDGRIKLYRNPQNLGVNDSFARAMSLASGDIIFLSDQDDIWVEGRAAAMLAPFGDTKVNVVAANYTLIDANGEPTEGYAATDLRAEDDVRRIGNVARIFRGNMNYYGCAMALRADFRRMILPYPPGLECHDIWIGLIANLQGSIRHLAQSTLLHRVHGQNASIIKRNMRDKLMARVYLLIQLASALCRLASRPGSVESSRSGTAAGQ